MPPEQLKRALPFQVADLLPVPVDQAVIDFYPVSQEQDQLSGLLVAAVAETVTELVDTAAQARLQVERVDLAPFGLLRAIGVLADSAETVALVHLGPHTGYVVVAAQGVPHFVRIIPVELSTATEAEEQQAEAQQAAEQQAEAQQAAIQQAALQQAPASQTPALQAPAPQAPAPQPVTPAPTDRRARRDPMALLFGDEEPAPPPVPPERIDDLVTQVINTLRFHVDRSQHRGIDRVLITGTGAGIPGVYAAFKSRLSVPVRLVGAHQLAQTDAKARHGQEDLELLTTVGLAMQGRRSWS
jgi:type IV pilus assembly protein PilM